MQDESLDRDLAVKYATLHPCVILITKQQAAMNLDL